MHVSSAGATEPVWARQFSAMSRCNYAFSYIPFASVSIYSGLQVGCIRPRNMQARRRAHHQGRPSCVERHAGQH
jgi:hypothetical protein